MSLSQVRDVYRRISATAKEFAQATSSLQRYDTPALATMTGSPTLSLPTPRCIRSQLLNDKRFHPDTVERISVLYRTSLDKLRAQLQANFAETWAKLVVLPRHNQMLPLQELGKDLVETYTRFYSNKADAWSEDLLASVSSLPIAQQQHDDYDPRAAYNCSNTSFKSRYVPILEAYFAENPRPSRAHKIFLANQSGMSYRQIHVWFQNRRSRTSRTRVSQEACANDAPIHESGHLKNEFLTRSFSLDSKICTSDEGVSSFGRYGKLSERLQSSGWSEGSKNEFVSMLPEAHQSFPSDDEEDAEYWPSEEKSDRRGKPDFACKRRSRDASSPALADHFDVFYNETPAYAFPTAYPPQCLEDPFPCRYGDTSCCKERLTRRTAAGDAHSLQLLDCDVSSLTAAFDKLTINDKSAVSAEDTGCHSAELSAPSGNYDVMSPYTIRPLRAPLDSLICKRVRSQLTPLRRPRPMSLPDLPGIKLGSGRTQAKAQLERNSLHASTSIANYLSESKEAASTPFYLSSTVSDESLPSLSDSSSVSLASDDDGSQGSPVLSFCEQDFLSPSVLCPKLPFVSPFLSSDNFSLLSDPPASKS